MAVEDTEAKVEVGSVFEGVAKFAEVFLGVGHGRESGRSGEEGGVRNGEGRERRGEGARGYDFKEEVVESETERGEEEFRPNVIAQRSLSE